MQEKQIENFLNKNMFEKYNHLAIFSLFPFLTPNTEIINDSMINARFRPSVERWSGFVEYATNNHYAYISINLPDEAKNITTIEIRHNESHPFEAFPFIFLMHHLLLMPPFAKKANDNTIVIDNIYKIYINSIYSIDDITVPIETFRHVISKILATVPNTSINNKIKYHIWQVYQNIISNKRIYYNDDIYRYYNYKNKSNIQSLMEDIANNNVTIKLKANKVEINYNETIIYATKIILETPKVKKSFDVKQTIILNDYTKIEPSPSKKSAKTLTL